VVLHGQDRLAPVAVAMQPDRSRRGTRSLLGK
jgi:hypothetical protein